ncbi:MAG: SDR family oxidoreductase [Leptospiraceae bacterium]|nr:SDR family oxidoreductase [Leptospiraceae bacterium]MDW8306988.1 SDR family oxidoreductase [Leptospiraceae bacterium]
MSFDFNQKRFLITGAAGGIGLALTEELLKRGAFVLACDIRLDGLESLLAKWGGEANRLEIAELDVRHSKDWQNIFKKPFCENLYGVIQSAGVIKPGYVKNAKPEDVDFHIDINTKGVMLGSLYAAQHLSRLGRGHIINIASLAGISAIPGIALYTASKFAVRGFTLALAEELRRDNVAVTVICPDAVATPMFELQIAYREAALTFSGKEPLTPQEVTEAIIEAIIERPREVSLPFFRSTLAKLAGALPDLASLLLEPLQKKGLEQQEKLRSTRLK